MVRKILFCILLVTTVVGLSSSETAFGENITLSTASDETTDQNNSYEEENNYHSRGKCVMFGLCGYDLEFRPMTCKVNHGPRELDEDSLLKLKTFCPELVEEHGPYLCCSADQVEELIKNLGMPQTLIERCSSCFHNFRRSFCEFSCSPHQSKFLNVTQVAPTPSEALEDDPELPKEIVRQVDFYISKKYIQETYDSCKNVQFMFAPAMKLLCGPWGSEDCTAERWFQYMGSTPNGYSPFDVIYRPVDKNQQPGEGDTNAEIEPLDIPTYSCAEAPPGTKKRCACEDCPLSCSVSKSVPSEDENSESRVSKFLKIVFSKVVGLFA